ncbi:unnamed protein product [Tetraodon nigroviridis]|uniref:Chromosome 11 SCAF14642, whole genome shotgun sequence n=1 Tax=Tetraodon nigroviridis TaxID=99883 RepID=Q4SD58_TETNG|nr:unnamed protein product [Tetraodon nigroviridis]
MMEEIDRFQVPPVNGETQPLDPAASTPSEGQPDAKGETVAMNYKPTPLQVQIGREISDSVTGRGSITSDLQSASIRHVFVLFSEITS